jgi:hypothetical protein
VVFTIVIMSKGKRHNQKTKSGKTTGFTPLAPELVSLMQIQQNICPKTAQEWLILINDPSFCDVDGSVPNTVTLEQVQAALAVINSQ